MLSLKELDQIVTDFAAWHATPGFSGLPEEMQALLMRMNHAILQLRELREAAVATAA